MIITSLLLVAGCSQNHEDPNVELIQNMMEMPSYKAQKADPNSPDGSAMREPVKGTIPRDYHPYPYANSTEGAAAAAKNPNPLPRTMAVFKRGEHIYNTYCIVCHGTRGEANGSIVGQGKFPMPPSLHSDKVAKEWSDGRIFHVITLGQNVMPSYASQISVNDRWAVIHYVRALQRANNPTEADLREVMGKGQGDKK